jgi:apolipoprotein N-acyltransferase
VKNYLFVLAILFGLIHGFVYAPFNSVLSAIISISGFYFCLSKSDSLKNSLKLTFLFGFTYYLFSLHWIANSLFVDIKQWWPFLFPVLLGFPLFLSTYYLVISIPFFYLKKRLDRDMYRVIIFGGLWCLSEYLKSNLFTGFPWNILGTVWIGLHVPVDQIIHYTNVYILSFLTILLSCSIYLSFKKPNLTNITLVTSVCLCLASPKLHSSFKKSTPIHNTKSLKIRLVQSNIEQKFKWTMHEQDILLNKMLDLTFKQGFKDNPDDQPDLIIWPENVFPIVFDIHDPYRYDYLDKIIFSLKPRQKLVLGALRINQEGGIFNSMVAVQNNPGHETIDFYDKRHLVPFGEFIPFYNEIQNILPFNSVNNVFSLFSNLSGGAKEKNDLNLGYDIKILPLICYEGIFPFVNSNGAKFAINITNDGWFGNSFGRYQHLRGLQAQVIKTKINTLRVANGGITAVIDENGKILESIELNKEGIIDFVLHF